jgi:hypothetical protein
MLAGSYLRHNPAILGMNGYLGGDHTGKNGTAVANHCGGRLITGCFKGKNEHQLLFCQQNQIIGTVRSRTIGT